MILIALSWYKLIYDCFVIWRMIFSYVIFVSVHILLSLLYHMINWYMFSFFVFLHNIAFNRYCQLLEGLAYICQPSSRVTFSYSQNFHRLIRRPLLSTNTSFDHLFLLIKPRECSIGECSICHTTEGSRSYNGWIFYYKIINTGINGGSTRRQFNQINQLYGR